MLKEGTKAPDFALCDKDGKTITLQDFTGKKLVLYFYPKDNTAGCTKQACAFAAVYEGFKDKDVAVVGISKDSSASHRKFAEKYDLPFILLSDPELKAIQAYDVWSRSLGVCSPKRATAFLSCRCGFWTRRRSTTISAT